mmetsp:Transcript_50323/g.105043  ORF Transcript_50323/g.105043 Transcript_50323/m.105043 type:complete len:141 (-) Transcript_50323:451-873(-)
MDDLLATYKYSTESSQIVIDSDSEQNTAASSASLSAQHGSVSEKSKPKTFRQQAGIFQFFAPVGKDASQTQQDSSVSDRNNESHKSNSAKWVDWRKEAGKVKRAQREKARRERKGLFSNSVQRQTKKVNAFVRAECERTG